MARIKPLRRYHGARWDEEMIFELSVPGERGVLPPLPEPEILDEVGDPLAELPHSLRRQKPPALPEVHQQRVLRHYLRLSQETMGADITIEASHGTCTMKYSPKVQEHMAGHPGLSELHPLQDPDTLQGILEIYYQLEQYLKEISGLDAFSFQPGGGAHAVFTNACILRAYHQSRDEGHRDEIITTIFSHPSNAAAPKTAGYKIITLMPDEDGYPDFKALEAALSERTAGLFITNPEDTGIYNPQVDKITNAVHRTGGLCVYDQANANSLLGIARAREAGFDLCHFNLHKTFSSPHGCMGPAVGAAGARKELEPFLPIPRVVKEDGRYRLDYQRPQSIGRVRSFFGNAPVVFRAYAWIRQHGPEGLKEVSRLAVLNSNYLEHHLRRLPEVSVWYAEGKRRLEQVRYSLEKLKQDTGVGTSDVQRRMADFGLQHYWTSHHPWLVPEPFTLEPTESYSQADLDEYLAILEHIIEEAKQDPDLVKNSPYNCAIHKVPAPRIDEPERIAVTWRQYQRLKAQGKRGKGNRGQADGA